MTSLGRDRIPQLPDRALFDQVRNCQGPAVPLRTESCNGTAMFNLALVLNQFLLCLDSININRK
jgi:hypothetical protein